MNITTHIFFKSNKFLLNSSSSEAEEYDAYNGKNLAEWLKVKLEKSSIEVQTPIPHEGYYELVLNFENQRFFLTMSNYLQDDEDDSNWLLIINQMWSFAALFKSRNVKTSFNLATTLHEIIVENEMENIRWVYKKDFDQQIETNAFNSPKYDE